MALTVLLVPTDLEAKLAVPPLRLTLSLPSIPLSERVAMEAAVVPSPDPVRLAVPKAYVVLKPGLAPSPAAAHALFRFSRQRLPPYARLRRLEFAELPKTISGKIRRVDLRRRESERHGAGASATAPRAPNEYWAEDFPELK